jgi:hypothetical protein
MRECPFPSQYRFFPGRSAQPQAHVSHYEHQEAMALRIDLRARRRTFHRSGMESNTDLAALKKKLRRNRSIDLTRWSPKACSPRRPRLFGAESANRRCLLLALIGSNRPNQLILSASWRPNSGPPTQGWSRFVGSSINLSWNRQS